MQPRAGTAGSYRLTDGRVPLVASGGIFTGEDAYAKARARRACARV